MCVKLKKYMNYLPLSLISRIEIEIIENYHGYMCAFLEILVISEDK